MRFCSSILISVALLLAFVSPGCRSEPERYETACPMMGAELRIIIHGMDMEPAREAAEAAIAEVRRLNDIFSLWDKASALSKLNEDAGRGWAKTDIEIVRLLGTSLDYAAATEGAFDVTAGPLVQLWGFLSRGGERRPPTEEEIAEAHRRTGWRGVRIDAADSAVRFQSEGMELDFGAVAKGYAVDRAAEVLADRGVTGALVNLGGNIRTIGSPPARRDWIIAVRDPGRRDGLLGAIELPAASVASSGQYERFFEYRGRRYGHIIDPRTGRPVEGILGTTIVAPSATLADILSTAVFVLGGEEGAAYISGHEGVEGIIVLPGESGSLRILVSRALAPHFKLDASVEGSNLEVF